MPWSGRPREPHPRDSEVRARSNSHGCPRPSRPSVRRAHGHQELATSTGRPAPISSPMGGRNNGHDLLCVRSVPEVDLGSAVLARPPVAPCVYLSSANPEQRIPASAQGRVRHSEAGLLDELVAVRRPAAAERRPKHVAAVSGSAPHGARRRRVATGRRGR
jgi:hypothetical protein